MVALVATPPVAAVATVVPSVGTVVVGVTPFCPNITGVMLCIAATLAFAATAGSCIAVTVLT